MAVVLTILPSRVCDPSNRRFLLKAATGPRDGNCQADMHSRLDRELRHVEPCWKSQTLYHKQTSWVAPGSKLDSSLHRPGPSSIVFHEEENHA